MTAVPLRLRPLVALVAATTLALGGTAALAPQPAAAVDRTFALAGSLQSEIGCPGDWQPECAASELAPTAVDGVFAAEFAVPAGSYEYKVAVNDTWDEAYGQDGGADNIPLVIAGPTTLRFSYDDTTHRTAVAPVALAGGYTPADSALVAAPAEQKGSEEQFYFAMTDRFKNSDPTNDTGGLTGDALKTGFDPTNKGFYHGGDLAGLRDELDYIEGLGTTALWLTPSFKNKPVQGTGANVSAGYHGYWITDFTQIDPHLGTNAELEALIDDAHARGIKVYFDIITNHTADVIDYTQGTHDYIDQATAPYKDAAGTVFDPATYAGTDTFPALDPATSFPYTPVIAPAETNVKVPAWLNDPTLYHNRGDSTWTGESVTYGDFSGLDDLMTEHPTVVNGFVEVYDKWIDSGIDGFRIDTVKHVNLEFWQKWTTKVLDYAHAHAKPDFFMFGEVYDAEATKLAPYMRETDMSALLDFPFQAGAAAFARGSTGTGLSKLFASDDQYTTPDTSAAALPTFLGNHDMGRIGHMVKGSGSELERSELAHSLMYLTRGQPVVYYGDEQGFVGDGDLGGSDRDARQSLFASQVPEYVNQQLLTGETAGAVDRFDVAAPLYTHIAALAELRTTTPALRDGAQIERFADASAYAFSRVDRDEKIEHLVALNNSTAARTITLTSLTPGATFAGLYGTTTPVTADAEGKVTLTVPALNAVVLKANAQVGAPATAGPLTLTTPAAGAALAGLAPVTADVDDDVWQETSFAARVVGDTGWTALGTAQNGSPRVFHDVRKLAKGTLVEYRAVAVDAAGHRSAASTFASVGLAVDGVVPPPVDPGTGPTTVTVAGSHNQAMGCASDWQPDCTAAQLTKRTADGMWSGTFDLPAGAYEYKVAIDGSWDENYGAGGVAGGPNTGYVHPGGSITFYYDPVTHYFSSTSQGPIMALAGSFQSELGCPGDWQPDCLAAWLEDLDGDSIFTFTTDKLPTGSYELKVAHNLSWDENYGAGGVPDGANIPFDATEGTPVTFSYDPVTHVLTVGSGSVTLPGVGESRAQWIDAGTIAWPADLVPAGTDPAALSWKLHSAADGSLEVTDGAVVGGASLDLTYAPGGLSAAQLARFPALKGYLALTVTGADRAAVETLLKGELLVGEYAADGAAAAITGVQIPGVVDDLYANAAARRALGATWKDGRPSVALWAPTAQKVDLLLWTGQSAEAVAGEPTRVAMTRRADGSWVAPGRRSWAGAAYRYEVSVYAPTTDTVEANQVTDPYSVALTTNSTHSVLINLADKAYRPRTWEKTRQPVVADPVDQTIYELHVRDFSINDKTVPAALRGTYGAFGYDGAGRKHLRTLADAGLTTVHLLPTFDIATIEEDRTKQEVPAGDLAALPPDSDQQQAAVTAVADKDGYNWGYDPLHYSAPEGSYARNPDGGARVAEFRTMVGALHQDGLQVVLDQVFNHTAASGQDPKSVLDRVVPGYYQRLNAAGKVETSTCCQNVATEHAMAQELMVDSVVLWARDYKVDGFRFDLMGHHSVETMKAVRAGLDALTVRRDGVNGKAVYLYGEGWNFGEVANNALFTQATQGQLGGSGIGTFSDRLRDGVRGGGPFDDDPGIQGFGSGQYTDPNGSAANGTPAEQLTRVQHDGDLVRLGLAGNLRDFSFLTSAGTVQKGAELDYNGQPAGYADEPEEVISYVDAHDNETLFDALTLKLPPATTMKDRVRMNTLSLATTALSQTPSFWHAGAEMLRSKSLDRNSFNSGDWFNSLDFTGKDNGFGRGLPPAADNEAKWPFQQPLLANPALKPAPADIASAEAASETLLRLRFSTELFRLGDAGLIEQKVTFPGSGPAATPGVIVMRVNDRVGADADRNLDGVLVVFNASDEPTTQKVAGLARHDYALSPILARGSDPVVKKTTWTRSTGEVTVPARTVAVLTEKQHR